MPGNDVKDLLEGHAEVLPSTFRGIMSEMALMSMSSGRTSGGSLRVLVGSTFDGEPRDGGHCSEDAPDIIIALGENRVAESFKMTGKK